MRVFDCNWRVSKANKTNENGSVRTGQVELANRRQGLALPKFNQRAQPRLSLFRHQESISRIFGMIAYDCFERALPDTCRDRLQASEYEWADRAALIGAGKTLLLLRLPTPLFVVRGICAGCCV
jgi:hypothetical protein